MLPDAEGKTKGGGSEEGRSSSEIPPEPSQPPEMLTREQAEKLANERHSKLDKRISELEKQSNRAVKGQEAAQARAQAAETAYAELQRERESQELEGIKDNPDALTIFQRKKALREMEVALNKREAEMKRREEENTEALAEVTRFKVVKQAMEIVAKPGYEDVSAEDLIELTDGTPEKMEKMALKLAKLKPKASEKTEPFEPDSARNKGGASKPTQEQLEKMTPAQYAEWAKTRFK